MLWPVKGTSQPTLVCDRSAIWASVISSHCLGCYWPASHRESKINFSPFWSFWGGGGNDIKSCQFRLYRLTMLFHPGVSTFWCVLTFMYSEQSENFPAYNKCTFFHLYLVKMRKAEFWCSLFVRNSNPVDESFKIMDRRFCQSLMGLLGSQIAKEKGREVKE